MSSMTDLLKGSFLFRPWVKLACFSSEDIYALFADSRLLGKYLGAENLQGSSDGSSWLVWMWLAFIGLMGLFVLLTVMSTGVIGVATWALLVLLVLALVMSRLPKAKHAVFSRLTSPDLLVLAFLGSALLSTAFSSFFHTSLIGFAKMLTFVAGYIVFRVLSGHRSRFILISLITLACLGFVESLIGFYQHIHHIQPLATWSDPSINPELQMDRIFGTLKPSNPNLLAGFLTPCLASAIGCMLLSCTRTRWPFAVLFSLMTGTILTAMLWTGSRGGFLVIGGIVLMAFLAVGHLLWHDKTLKSYPVLKSLWAVVLVLGLAGGTLGIVRSEKLRARAASMFAMREDSSISYRLNVYQSAMRMVRDNPVVGIGPGNSTFKIVYGLYMVPGYSALGSYSVPLEITVEQGFIGLLVFMSLLTILKFRAIFTLDDPHRRLQDKIIIFSLWMGVSGSFIYGLFDTIWYRPSVNLLFWFMAAALACMSEPTVHRLSPELSRTSQSCPVSPVETGGVC